MTNLLLESIVLYNLYYFEKNQKEIQIVNDLVNIPREINNALYEISEEIDTFGISMKGTSKIAFLRKKKELDININEAGLLIDDWKFRLLEWEKISGKKSDFDNFYTIKNFYYELKKDSETIAFSNSRNNQKDIDVSTINNHHVRKEKVINRLFYYETQKARCEFEIVIGRFFMNTIVIKISSIMAIILTALASIIFMLNTSKYLINMVQKLEKGFSRVSSGDLDYILETNTNDEFASLARSFNLMTEKLKTMQKVVKDLTSHTIKIQEEERKRISRDLHDGVNQTLSAAILSIKSCSRTIISNKEECDIELEEAIKYIIIAQKEISSISYDLRPPLLDDLGLFAAIKWYAETIGEKYSIDTDVSISEDESFILSETKQVAIFRTIQEVLNNIAKHARAKNINLNISCNIDEFSVNIKDNGIGFDMDEDLYSTQRAKHMGIAGMYQRISQIGGKFVIKSKKNHGTEVIINLPQEKNDGR